MPLLTPQVPLSGHPDAAPSGHLNRRGLSQRQSSSVAKGTWPTLVTQSVYDQLAREGKVGTELANLRVRRLCMAKCALGRAKLAIDGAMHDHRPGRAGLTPQQIEEDARVWQELRATSRAIEKAYLRFPMEVRG
jgi:hypothetical protein